MTQKRSLRHFSIHRRGEGVQPRELAPTLIWVATAAVLAFAVVYPSVVLILSSFKTPQGYGFGNYLAVFQDKAIGVSVLNTVKVVFPSTLLSTFWPGPWSAPTSPGGGCGGPFWPFHT